jgi:predicted nucleic acid-binding Zn ribbon protein
MPSYTCVFCETELASDEELRLHHCKEKMEVEKERR